MDSSVGLLIYGLSAHNGKRFKISVAKDYLQTTVKDLKTRILHERKIPVECQTLFICKGKNQLALLKDEEQVPRTSEDGSSPTLHLYVTKAAQQRSLEKTRKSDFDDWLKRLKELRIEPQYKEEALSSATLRATTATVVPAATAPVDTPAPAAHQNRPTEFAQMRAKTAYQDDPMPQTEYVEVAAPAGAAAQDDAGWILKSYNSVADFCHLCNRDGRRNRATHYCHNCDEYNCVLCMDCAKKHSESHDVEEMQRKARAPSGASSAGTPAGTPAAARNMDEDFAKVLNRTMNLADPDSWTCDVCTMKNNLEKNYCTVCDAKKPGYEKPVAQEAAPGYNWQCEQCTYLNLPYRPSCSLCAADRPADYQIPLDYEPQEEERKFVDGAIASRLAVDQVLEEEKRQAAEQRELNRKLLLDTDERSIIVNDASFECSICFTDCEIGDGIKLRECLHTFCKDCLKGHIESSENPEVQCPFMNDNYQCNEAMQEREIREIAPDFYPKLLEKSLQVAESQAADSFHCKTLNCQGWCTYDDDVNFFQCPVCGKNNCLTCQAIHEGQDCKEYQDDLKRKAEIDDESKKTQEELERLLNDHLAMHCPKCKIVIMKNRGCSWIMCSVCKTEICWVTRQARWGPKGAGDTSAGCKCGVGGKLCDPKCGNCH